MLVTISLVCFAIAVLLGITLAVLYPKGKLSFKLAIPHGLFAAAGLVLLIIAALKGMVSALGIAALVLFIIAALGGDVLFFLHLKKKPWPKPLIAIHGLLAVIAFLLLLFGAV